MLISDRKLRIYGPVAFALIYFVFFLSQILIQPHDHTWLLLLKSIGATILFTAILWEPVRYIILFAHKKWGDKQSQLKRKVILSLILFPYSFLIGIFGQLLENYLIWQRPIKKEDVPFFMGVIGVNFIFILTEVALYESLFFVDKWHRSALEMKELKKVNLQLQYDSLKLQIQPHFLFNTLNTLIGLIEMDQKRAVKFTEELAYVYRYLLSANDRPLIGLDEEWKFTNAYYFLLKNRYPDGLYLQMEEVYNMHLFMVPPLSLQILVENAVKHNVITNANPLHVRIRVNPGDQNMVVSNNLQRKNEFVNTGLGLLHLGKKFELLDLNGISIVEKDELFTVTLPLKKTAEHESIDY